MPLRVHRNRALFYGITRSTATGKWSEGNRTTYSLKESSLGKSPFFISLPFAWGLLYESVNNAYFFTSTGVDTNTWSIRLSVYRFVSNALNVPFQAYRNAAAA